MAPQEKYSLLSQDEFSPEPGCAEEESSLMLPQPNVYGYSDHVLVLEPSPMSDSDDSSLVSYNSTPISSPEIPPEKSPSRIARFFSSPKRVVTIAIVLAVIAVIIFLGVRGILSHAIFVIVSGVHSLGPWGAVLMVITYWVFVPFCVPITMLNLGSGFLFDFGIGTLVSSLGIMGGATISFGIARRFAPKWIHDRLDKWEYFRVLDDALQYGQTTRQHIESAAMVTLVRLPPLFPWALINYFLGITKVSFRSYFLGSYLGLIPTVAVEVYMGSLLEELSQVRSSNPEAFLITAIAVTIGVTLVITIVARRKLAKMKHAFDLRNAAVLPSVVVADTDLTASLEAQAALQTVAVKC